jgi:DNA-binding MarR family transcriptional regulator
MASRRLSRLQRQILRQLFEQDQRTQGGIIMGHFELVQKLRQDKGNISHSLQTLEARGLIRLIRTPGGLANSVELTSAGRKVAATLEKGCD